MFLSTDKIFVMGRSGCGKSYIAKIIQKIWPRRIIIDTLNEYSENDFRCVYSFEEFSNFLLENQNNSNFTVVYKFDVETSNQGSEFNEVMRLCYYFGNILIVIEEVQLFSTIHEVPHWLKNNVLIGRHRNIGMLFTSQRAGEINKTILSQCGHIFVGSMVEGNDIRYISGFLNQDSKLISSLPIREFLYYGPHGIKKIGPLSENSEL